MASLKFTRRRMHEDTRCHLMNILFKGNTVHEVKVLKIESEAFVVHAK